MTAKPKSNEQDQALAAYTDAVLEGRVPETDVAPELRVVVHRLASTLQPAAPPETLRRRILQQVRREWQAARAPWWANLAAAARALARGLGRAFTRNPAWSAMAALVIIGLLVALLTPERIEIAGTVAVPMTGIGAAFVGAALVLGGIVFWRRRRHQRRRR